jgi:hypothetical protein
MIGAKGDTNATFSTTNGLAWDWIRVSAVITRRLTIWAIARPKIKSMLSTTTAATPPASRECRHASTSSPRRTVGFPINQTSETPTEPWTFGTELTCWRPRECLWYTHVLYRQVLWQSRKSKVFWGESSISTCTFDILNTWASVQKLLGL